MKNDTEKNAAEANITFKKVMRGFDPEEVIAYISEMSRTMQEASKVYEIRMAEMKQELTLVNRERDNLRIKCDELEKSIAAPLPEPVPEPVPVLSEFADDNRQGLIDELQKKLDEEAMSGATAKEELQNANMQIAELSLGLEDKEKQLLSCLEKINILETQSGRNDSVREQYEEALVLIENLKSQVSGLEEEKAQLISDSENAEAHFRKALVEAGGLKTELSRISVENSLLAEKNEQYKTEISELKAEAKNKAYEFAEKLSTEEDELNREKIRLQKKLQLQNYHIEQANTAVDELKKQIEQIRISFSE